MAFTANAWLTLAEGRLPRKLLGSRRMRIGVVSDTHDNLKNVRQIVDLLNSAGVERVVHTGDITKAKTLDVLADLQAPLVGVFGNNDRERDALTAAIQRHGFHFVDPPLRLHWAGRRIAVVHDPLEATESVTRGNDVLIHGHTHRRVKKPDKAMNDEALGKRLWDELERLTAPAPE